MNFLWLYLIYSIAVLIICYFFEIVRYKLFLGYFLGSIFGGVLAFYFDLDIAMALAIFVGLATTAKMHGPL